VLLLLLPLVSRECSRLLLLLLIPAALVLLRSSYQSMLLLLELPCEKLQAGGTAAAPAACLGCQAQQSAQQAG